MSSLQQEIGVLKLKYTEAYKDVSDLCKSKATRCKYTTVCFGFTVNLTVIGLILFCIFVIVSVCVCVCVYYCVCWLMLMVGGGVTSVRSTPLFSVDVIKLH